ncbi:MAG: hypothetical protein COY81_01365 [Candidatus Pacebacteria bacterium CG_4_10_14_0_8_um_filter_43_12]|nr:MAG: hypothetical protein COY81_01365 [Candidatus Pacebacteria bacterium CG_4_10_14_0_8_um_filter_43_12]
MTSSQFSINKNEYKCINYQFKGKIIEIYFHSPKYSFHEFFEHKRRTTTFPHYRNLLDFLFENEGLSIFFTLDEINLPFIKIDDDLLVNMDQYQQFCVEIGSKTSGRAKAFFGKHLSLSQMLTDEEKKDLLSLELKSQTVVDAVQQMSEEEQKSFLERLNQVIPINSVDTNTSQYNLRDLVNALKNFSSNATLRHATLITLPYIQLNTLKENLSFLKDALGDNKTETDIQNWIDEDNRKYSKQRCMVFGIEFIDPKREGELSRKRFDVLAEQNRRYHIIIELKGPEADIFEVKQVLNNNGGVSTEYRISEELSRAIPQVLGYKKLYLEMSSEELETIGLKEKKEISKCIIVIGKRSDSSVWLENFDDLKNSLNGIEIWTYTDLVEKLENTIENLENNL